MMSRAWVGAGSAMLGAAFGAAAVCFVMRPAGAPDPAIAPMMIACTTIGSSALDAISGAIRTTSRHEPNGYARGLALGKLEDARFVCGPDDLADALLNKRILDLVDDDITVDAMREVAATADAWWRAKVKGLRGTPPTAPAPYRE